MVILLREGSREGGEEMIKGKEDSVVSSGRLSRRGGSWRWLSGGDRIEKGLDEGKGRGKERGGGLEDAGGEGVG